MGAVGERERVSWLGWLYGHGIQLPDCAIPTTSSCVIEISRRSIALHRLWMEKDTHCISHPVHLVAPCPVDLGGTHGSNRRFRHYRACRSSVLLEFDWRREFQLLSTVGDAQS